MFTCLKVDFWFQYQLLASGVWQMLCGLQKQDKGDLEEPSNRPLLGTGPPVPSYCTSDDQNIEVNVILKCR